MGQITQHFMVAAALSRRFNQFAAKHDVLVATALIDIIML